MENANFKNVSPYKDRHGKVRWRYRKKGAPSHSFKANYGTAEFLREYEIVSGSGIGIRTPSPKIGLSKLKGVPVIYFVGPAKGKIKIGFTTDINSRLTRLNTGSPVKLVLHGIMRGTVDEERLLHERFDSLRTHGEWFYKSGELAQLVKENQLGPWRTDLWNIG